MGGAIVGCSLLKNIFVFERQKPEEMTRTPWIHSKITKYMVMLTSVFRTLKNFKFWNCSFKKSNIINFNILKIWIFIKKLLWKILKKFWKHLLTFSLDIYSRMSISFGRKNLLKKGIGRKNKNYYGDSYFLLGCRIGRLI